MAARPPSKPARLAAPSMQKAHPTKSAPAKSVRNVLGTRSLAARSFAARRLEPPGS